MRIIGMLLLIYIWFNISLSANPVYDKLTLSDYSQYIHTIINKKIMLYVFPDEQHNILTISLNNKHYINILKFSIQA